MNSEKIKNLFSKYKKYLPIFYFATIAFLILAPVLDNSYILSFDMIFTPDMHPGESFSLEKIYRNILYINAIFVPAWLLQKILFSIIFFGIGYLAYRLSLYIFKTEFISIILGTFYIINPFVYDRYIAGHWLFLIGYALTPLFVLLTIKTFVEESHWKYLRSLIILWLLIPFISQHHFLLWGIIFLVFSLWEFINQLRVWKDITLISNRSVINLAINIVWIGIVIYVSRDFDFSSDQLIAFASSSSGSLGIFGNLAIMHGMWLEDSIIEPMYTRNILSFSPWIIFITLAVLSLTLIFVSKLRLIKKTSEIPFLDKYSEKTNKLPHIQNVLKISIPILIITTIGFVLSFGSYEIIGDLYRFFFDRVPLLRGMREPQKFLNLYIIGFMILMGMSIKIFEVGSMLVQDRFLGKISTIRLTILLSILVAVFITNYPILWSASGNVSSYDYPEVYEETNSIMVDFSIENEALATLLVLPYTPFIQPEWTDNNRILNPANRYFDAEVISPTDIDFEDRNFEDEGCIVEFRYNPGFEDGSEYISCFREDDDQTLFSNTLIRLGIEYILVNNYGQQQDTRLFDDRYFNTIIEDKHGTLYEVIRPS